ncbi:MAG: autotransporter domain-containing protein [Planctomycetia bacterium]|nr:autotransporter domain-containing protein [Planctomycetia bacterium]
MREKDFCLNTILEKGVWSFLSAFWQLKENYFSTIFFIVFLVLFFGEISAPKISYADGNLNLMSAHSGTVNNILNFGDKDILELSVNGDLYLGENGESFKLYRDVDTSAQELERTVIKKINITKYSDVNGADDNIYEVFLGGSGSAGEKIHGADERWELSEGIIIGEKVIFHAGGNGVSGDVGSTSGGNGGSASFVITGGKSSFAEMVYLGGNGGENAQGGNGGNITFDFSGETLSFLNGGYFGGTGGDGSSEISGGNGGNAVLHFHSGDILFDGDILSFGGKGGNGGENVLGGNGGDVTLNITGGTLLFQGKQTFFGGSGGDSFSGKNGGNAGNVTINISGGETSFTGEYVQIGGTPGRGISSGLAGECILNISGGEMNFFCEKIDFASAGGGVLTLSDASMILGSGSEFIAGTGSRLETSGGSLLFQVDLSATDSGSRDVDGNIIYSTCFTAGSMAFTDISVSDETFVGVEIENIIMGTHIYQASGADSLILKVSDAGTLEMSDRTVETLFYSTSITRGNTENGENEKAMYVRDITVHDPAEVIKNIGGNAVTAGQVITQNVEAYSVIAQSQTYDDVRNATDLLMGTSFTSILNAQIQRMDILNQTLWDQISAIRFSQHSFSFWASGYGGVGEIDGNQYCGYDYDFYGGMIGGEFHVLNYFRMGVYYALGKTSLNSELKYGAMGVDSQDNTFGIYLKWQSLILGGYSFVQGNYSFSEYDTWRNILGEAYLGKFEGTQWGVYFEKGWHSSTASTININSFIAVGYQEINTDAFYESGAGILALSQGEMDMDSLRVYLGARTQFYFGEILTFSINATYIYEFMDENPSVMTSFINCNDVIMITGRGLGDNWVNLGAGAKLSLGSCISFMANYNCNWGDSIFHTGMGTLRFDF